MTARRRARQVQIRTLMLAVAVAAVGFAALRLPGVAHLGFVALDFLLGLLLYLVGFALISALTLGLFSLSERVVTWWAGPDVQPSDDAEPGRGGDGPA